jgi:hypothetical protein
MTGGSDFMMLVVVVVAFIAGYSIVSFVARKLKAGQTATNHQRHTDSNPTTEDPDLK